MKKQLLLFTLTFASTALANKCPELRCGSEDEAFLYTSPYCFQVTQGQNGIIQYIKMKGCNKENKEICYMPEGRFVWPKADLQFLNKPASFAESQFYGKLKEATCKNKPDVITTRLEAGRKCLYNYQCLLRKCDTTTNVCTGLPRGQSCQSHQDCDADLSCRSQSVWPFTSTCQPRGEVGSLCDSDFECKSRNFCWKLQKSEDAVCIEKHNAPYGTQFFWDSEKFPKVDKESVLFHGQFCQSGTAMRRSTDVAECVQIDTITLSSSDATALAYPYKCTPDGTTKCIYKSGGEVAFSLTCECGLRKDSNGKDVGYCPLPKSKADDKDRLMKQYIANMRLVWFEDDCHTHDRDNFIAQIDCGVGNNDDTLTNAVESYFVIKYYPFIQEAGNFDCLKQVLPESTTNVFV